ncbi:uncharacterized protein DS421_15g500890 [Arachis hypogaea]|nr:uncharacterized protein DS421_15g500890 [Arachis hypogaea]
MRLVICPTNIIFPSLKKHGFNVAFLSFQFGSHCNFFCWVNEYNEQQSVGQFQQEAMSEFKWKLEILESEVNSLKMMMMVTGFLTVAIGVGLIACLMRFLVSKQ